jgi:hypothetical protein
MTAWNVSDTLTSLIANEAHYFLNLGAAEDGLA